MYTILFFVILIIIIADFALDRYIDYLNTTRWSDRLPDELKGIYDEEKYAKQQAYQRENYRVGLFASGINFALVLAMLLFFGFAFVDDVAASLSGHPTLQALAFFGILMLAAEVINLPFGLYGTFVIEEKYGFNKTTVKTFIADKLKGWLLTAIIGGGILALIIWIYTATGSWFWIIAWGVLALFSIFMAMFYSNLIVPLFNKQTPLEEGELRTAISEFAQKTGFRLDNIFVINGSKRSTKANAYFTGLGTKKRIVLYDTLIAEMTTSEIVAVLAHEIGHYKKKHIVQGLVLGLLQTGILLFLFSLFIESPQISRAFGVDEPNFHIGMVAFSILYSPVSLATGLVMNMLSRRNEYQADAFAATQYQAGPLISALKKLSVNNLSNLTPHPAYVFFNYSHPPLLQRLNHLYKLEKR
jgi:STE24 endopeptidase